MTTLSENTVQNSFLLSQTPLSSTFKMCNRSIRHIFQFYYDQYCWVFELCPPSSILERKERFGNWACLCRQVRRYLGYTYLVWGPSERAQVSHYSSNWDYSPWAWKQLQFPRWCVLFTTVLHAGHGPQTHQYNIICSRNCYRKGSYKSFCISLVWHIIYNVITRQCSNKKKFSCNYVTSASKDTKVCIQMLKVYNHHMNKDGKIVPVSWMKGWIF
jgi:hypothetical protein